MAAADDVIASEEAIAAINHTYSRGRNTLNYTEIRKVFTCF